MMKKLFILVIGFVMFKMGYAQYPIQQFIGADSAIVTSKGAMQSRFVNVVFADTTAANSQRIKQYPGAMIYASGKMWVRNTTATAWVELAYGPVSSTNIYNSDGTLTGPRTLDGNNDDLTFDNMAFFTANANPLGQIRFYQGSNSNILMRGDTTAISRRLSYNTNLGSSFTKHSVVDKNYVDSLVSASPSGTVTSIATNNGTGITGGTITTTGTLAIDTSLISTRAWRQKGIDSVTSLINLRPTGTGTTNYLAKWTGSTALGNSLVFDNGTNVGIGTASPNYKLDVRGTIYTNNALWLNDGVSALNSYISSPTGFGGLAIRFGNNGYGGNLTIDPTEANARAAIYSTNPIWFRTPVLMFNQTFSVTNSSVTTLFTISPTTGNTVIGGGTQAGFMLDVQGTFRSTLDANINGLTVGKGGGSVATNTAVGLNALNATATGGTNTGIGNEALNAVSSGSSNTAIGYRAALNITSGSGNTAIGTASLQNATGGYNTSVGNTSGQNLTTGNQNTFLGHGTGGGITTGQYNTIIGAGVSGLSASLSNTIILADGQGNQRIVVNSSNQIGLGGQPVAPYPVHITAVSGYGLAVRNGTTTTKLTQINDGAIGLGDGSGNYATIENVGTSGTLRYTSAIHQIRVGTTNAIYIPATANVLIGTTTDGGQKLQVSGTSLFTSTMNVNLPFTPSVTAAVNFGSNSLNYGTTGLNFNMGSSAYNYGNILYVNRDYTNTGTQLTLSAIDITNNWTGRDWDALGTGTIYGIKISQSTANMPIYGGRFDVTLTKSNPTQTAYGVYSSATITGTGNAYSFYGAAGVLYNAGGVGIGTTSPNASALLDITSTTKGFLPPRMTGAQAEAIATPAAGLMVYANNGNGTTITSIGWWGYDGTNWVKLN